MKKKKSTMTIICNYLYSSFNVTRLVFSLSSILVYVLCTIRAHAVLYATIRNITVSYLVHTIGSRKWSSDFGSAPKNAKNGQGTVEHTIHIRNPYNVPKFIIWREDLHKNNHILWFQIFHRDAFWVASFQSCMSDFCSVFFSFFSFPIS